MNRQIRVGDSKYGTFDDEFLSLVPISPQIPKFYVTITNNVFFFSFTRPGRTAALIFTLNGSNGVFPPKDGPFRGLDDEWHHTWKIRPKNSAKRSVNKQFQTKTAKFTLRNISGTINPTNKRFEDRVQTTKGTSWVVRHYPKPNTTWQTAAILKIDMTSYYRRGWSDLDETRQPDAE